MDDRVLNFLIADDDPEDFELIKEAIEECNPSPRVVRAENRDILLKVLNNQIPDLLFLDIRMPCKDGKECLKKIRSNTRYDRMAIIICSSANRRSDVEYCFHHRANHFIVKPTSYDDLKGMVQQITTIDWKNAFYYPPLSNFVINPDLILM